MQIAEDSDVTSQFGSDFAHFVCASLVIFRAAVGEVKPNYVGTGGNDLFQIIVAVCSRTQGGNDFGSSEPSGHVLLR